MQLTSPNLDALRVNFSMLFQGAYSETPIFYNKIATEIPVNARTGVYGWIARQLQARKWLGPRVIQNLAEHAYQLTNEEYEATVGLNRYDVLYDNLGMFKSVALPGLATAMAKHPDIILNAAIQANTALAFDGLPMFSNAHLTYNGAGTYSNDFTTAPLNAANFNAAWAAMTAFTGEDGQNLGVMPTHLVHGPLLKGTALQLMNTGFYVAAAPGVTASTSMPGGATENVLKGWAEPLMIPELPGSVWYLMDLSKPIKPFIYQVGEHPQFVSKDQPGDDNVFNRNELLYGSSCSDAVGFSLPFLACRNTP